jgi:hypothetical protein
MRKNTIFGVLAVVALVACALAVWQRQSSHGAPMINDSASGNYGLFIDNLDSGYFSTTDQNVKRIVQAYLTDPNAKTDSDKYGYSLVFYYTKEVFIAEGLFSPTDRDSVSGFSMRDMRTGKEIGECDIYAQAGLYKDSDLLVSVSYVGEPPYAKTGVCLYERGTPNFTFIDLASKLSSGETLFSDPTGQNLRASMKKVDTQKKAFAVSVYDTAKKGPNGDYAYKRSIEAFF